MGQDHAKHQKSSKQTHSQQTSSPKASGLTTKKSEAMSANRRYNLSEFAVITTIFNPIKYKSRYNHYKNFAAHMAQSGVQLYTVECIFENMEKFGLPQQNFEVTQAGIPFHIQLRAPSIMWMKENLINIAVHRLPQNVNYVAWIDGDIEFERLDWAHLAIDELQRYPIVQLFELSYFLGPGGKKDILRRDYSFGYSIRHNKPIDPSRYNEWYPHPGYAWAMRRSAFIQMGGLIDCCIIGSGDLHFAFALLNRIELTIRPNLHPDYQNLAVTWANRLAQVSQNGINVSYVPINLYHHWHGSRNDRNYVDRWTILEKHQFSPVNDLEKHEHSGILRLVDSRHLGSPYAIARMDALQRDIVAYFISRKEDTNVNANQAQPPLPNKAKPFVAQKTQPNRAIRSTGGSSKPTRFQHNVGPRSRPGIWSSGPSGTHVDDHDPFWDQCCCPGHHHHPDNVDCPCSPNHHDDQHYWDHHEGDHHHHHHDQQGWNPSDDDHHHHHHHHDQQGWNPSDDDHHHHHHHHDQQGWNHSDNDYQHCDNSNTDNNAFNYDYSSGGGGYDHTDYGGPGSFY